jgi:hypothetical protein
MSGVLGRLADLASRTLATARPPRPVRLDQEQVAGATPDAAREPTSMPAPFHQTSAATAEAPTGPTAAARPATAEKGRPETDIAMAPPAAPAAAARPTLPHRDVAAQPLDRRSAPEPASAIPAVARTDQTVSTSGPGLLRDADIRVVPAVDAMRGAPVDRRPEDAPPELEERWRELGARLRAMHPPNARDAGREGARNAEVSTRPEAVEAAAVALARHATPPAPGEPSAAQHRSELIIRHLEIRIVAAAKEPAPVAKSRSPAPVTGAWQSAARRYLRL